MIIVPCVVVLYAGGVGCELGGWFKVLIYSYPAGGVVAVAIHTPLGLLVYCSIISLYLY